MPDHGAHSQCHQNCNDEIQKQIQVAVQQLCGTTENIYFQQDANYKAKLEGCKAKDDEPLTHRFLLSFVIPCPKLSIEKNKSSKGSGKSAVLHPPVAAQSLPNPYSTLLTTAEMEQFRQAEIDYVIKEAELEVLTQELENSDCHLDSMDVSNDLANDSQQSLIEAEQLMDFQNGFFPLSNEELHATIDEQLSKGTSGLGPKIGWGSSLFNDVAVTQVGKVRMTGTSSPVPQSSEVSSSSGSRGGGGANPAVSQENNSITFLPHDTIPFKSPPPVMKQVPDPSSMINLAMNPSSKSQQLFYPVNFSMLSTTQQQVLCPANLPSVSAILNGATSQQNWQLSRASASGQKPTISHVVRLTKQFSTPATFGGTRPSLLLPKPKGISQPNFSYAPPARIQPNNSTGKVRCRKKNPLQKTTDPAEESQSQFSDFPANAPKGHTYESWILEEGLYKVRKQGLHKKDDKDACPYACPACDKKYKNPNGIKYHARYAHGPKNSFFCEICKREYATRHGLSAHRKTHIVASVSQLTTSEFENSDDTNSAT